MCHFLQDTIKKKIVLSLTDIRSAMLAWFNLETRANANTRCLSSILFNSIHTREDHPSQDHFRVIILVRRERTFSRPNISCFELLTVHSFQVSRYAGSWVHIVFNTNILYLRKAFPVKWRRMTVGVRGVTETLSKLSCQRPWRDGNKCDILRKETISHMYIANWTILFLIIMRAYHFSVLSIFTIHIRNIYLILRLLPFAEARPSFLSQCGDSLSRRHYFSHSRFFLFPVFFCYWTGRKNRAENTRP